MQVIAKKTYDEASAAAADLLAAAILMKRDAKLGLATGATPVGCYKELVTLFMGMSSPAFATRNIITIKHPLNLKWQIL